MNYIPLSNSYVEAPNTNVVAFRDMAFVEVIKVKWVITVESPSNKMVIFIIRGKSTRDISFYTCILRKPCEDTGTKWPSSSQQ